MSPRSTFAIKIDEAVLELQMTFTIRRQPLFGRFVGKNPIKEIEFFWGKSPRCYLFEYVGEGAGGDLIQGYGGTASAFFGFAALLKSELSQRSLTNHPFRSRNRCRKSVEMRRCLVRVS